MIDALDANAGTAATSSAPQNRSVVSVHRTRDVRDSTAEWVRRDMAIVSS
jgi:hypothetical protein